MKKRSISALLIVSFLVVYIFSLQAFAAPSKSQVQKDIQAIQAQKSEGALGYLGGSQWRWHDGKAALCDPIPR